MIKIDRYILWTTFITVIGSLVLLSIIETFFTFLNELGDVGQDDYKITDVLLYLLYDLPVRLNRMIPMGLLLGILIGLGQLASTNELTVMRAAGLSKFRVLCGAIFTVIIMSIFSFLLSENIIPKTSIQAELYQNKQSTNEIVQDGFWAISNSEIVNVSAIHDGNLKNITMFDIEDQSIKSIIQSPNAYLDRRDWIMSDVTTTIFNEESITRQDEGNLTFPNLIDQRILDALIAKPENLSAKNLWRFIRYMEKNGLDSAEYRLAFWTKVFSPFMNFVMLVIVAPLVFSQNRQGNLGMRIFLGIMIGLIIYLATRILSHTILIFGYPPIAGAILPIVVALLIAFILFKFVASK
ncbi:LPS export ABC transporter permease LptG [Wohlfahrtiimonas larvae]|uniref:LPS export ABC transporter permease LptG n=2 Tax=Wohlfahrtiimonas larvae TaxID=1157986 RepID=A0ABP9MH89_9GAMM